MAFARELVGLLAGPLHTLESRCNSDTIHSAYKYLSVLLMVLLRGRVRTYRGEVCKRLPAPITSLAIQPLHDVLHILAEHTCIKVSYNGIWVGKNLLLCLPQLSNGDDSLHSNLDFHAMMGTKGWSQIFLLPEVFTYVFEHHGCLDLPAHSPCTQTGDSKAHSALYMTPTHISCSAATFHLHLQA